LASAAISCDTATCDLTAPDVVGGPTVHSRVPTGMQSADGGDSGLSGNITNVKHDFVAITVSGIVCSTQLFVMV